MRFWHWQTQARKRTRWLLLAFVLCVGAVVAAVHIGLSLSWLLGVALLPGHWAFGYPGGFVATNIGVTLLFILGGWWLEASTLKKGGPALARRVGARELRPSLHFAEQQLSNIVQEQCVAAHMPVPEVMVLPRADAINAFAAGWPTGPREPNMAVVAVTQGALDHLTRDELSGLVAHELSHLNEGDTRLNMQLAGMVYGLSLIYNFGHLLRERGGLGWWFGNAVVAAGFVGWLSGHLLSAAVSREREYLADARAVQWTRSKDGLGGVLRKVMGQREQELEEWGEGGNRRLHTGLEHPELRHMLLVDTPHASGLERWLDRSLLQAHPPLQARVQRIYGRKRGPLPLEHGKPPAAPKFYG